MTNEDNQNTTAALIADDVTEQHQLVGTEDDQAAAEAAEEKRKLEWIRGQVKKSVRVDGTPAEKYLVEVRQLKGPFPKSVRWSDQYQSGPDAIARPCLLSVVTDENGKIVALQSLELDPETGHKARKEKPHRFSNGHVGGGTVFLGTAGEPTPVLVIGEGVESVMTRNLVAPCDSHACLGSLRYVKPKKHHKRVEIIADTDKLDAARRLAKRYANDGYQAFVVTVPDILGPKADLNDALCQGSLQHVQSAVEDAECYIGDGAMSARFANFNLQIGSDVEIAHAILKRLEELYGPIFICEGKIWRYDSTHHMPLEIDLLKRLVHRADGTYYGEEKIVKLNKNRIASIIDIIIQYKRDDDYFNNQACGINCENGFIKVSSDGKAELLPHGRRHRQRHVVKGRYYGSGKPDKWKDSGLAKYLLQAFKNDGDEAPKKVLLLGEIAGCVALGWGTKVRNPVTIIAFSEAGGTGKSTYLKLLRALPNAEAIASVPAGKFGDEKYAFRLIGKVLNAVDELPDRAIRSDTFKRMITGEPVPARDLYRSATDFVPVALHVFSTNVLPSFSGGIDGGTARRLLPIEFTHVVPKNERDPELAERIIRDEADLLLHFAVEGACSLVKNKDFTVPQSSAALLDRWLLTSDPVRAWAAERLEITTDENMIAVADLYDNFYLWAEKSGIQATFIPNSISFGKRLPTAQPNLEPHRSNGSYYRNARLRTKI